MEDTSVKSAGQDEWHWIAPEVLNSWDVIEALKREAILDRDLEAARAICSEWASGENHRGSQEKPVPFTCSIEESCGPEPKAPEDPKLTPCELLAGEDASNGELKGIQSYEIRAVRCQSPACPRCAPAKAFRLSVELAAELETFTAPQLWTFTIDPLACPDQRRVYEHLKTKRAVSEIVRTLFEAGHLLTRRYFAAFEFQMGKRKDGDGEATEQVHIHVLLDSSVEGVPHSEVQSRWNCFLPDWAVPLEGKRKGRLGGVNFEPVDNKKGLALYATKYVGKGPQEGLPDWFKERLDEGKNCTLYSTSRGFWSTREKPVRVQPSKPATEKRERLTVDERLAKCGQKAAMFRVERWAVVGVEGWASTKHEYIGRAGDFYETAERLKATEAELERRNILIEQTHSDGRKIFDRGWDVRRLAVFLEEPSGKFIEGQNNVPKGEPKNGLQNQQKQERFARIRSPASLASDGGNSQIQACKASGLVP